MNATAKSHPVNYLLKDAAEQASSQQFHPTRVTYSATYERMSKAFGENINLIAAIRVNIGPHLLHQKLKLGNQANKILASRKKCLKSGSMSWGLI